MTLQDKLEIILITYNRKPHLKETFAQIFAKNSPIKDFQITILDNNSTDGTTEYIQEFIKNFPNVKHIVHNKNIGGNANIARALEIAKKEYLWVLCDDDNYNWQNWDEVKKGLEENYDVVFTETSNFKHFVNDASIMRAATFLPSTIYKTSLITNDVMQNAHFTATSLFPHLAVMAEALNTNAKIYVPQNPVITVGNRQAGSIETGFFTSKKENTHPYARDMFLFVGYINSVQLIKDKKKKEFILNHMSAKKTGFFREIAANFKRNRLYYNNSFKNICDVFCGISFGQKIQFLLALIWLEIIYFVKKFILRDKRYIGVKK